VPAAGVRMSSSSRPLDGQVALVTGASRGIGRAFARELARRGAWVAVNFVRNRAAADECLAAIRSEGGDGGLLGFDIADLGAAYLGGASVASLARAERVTELTSGALLRADRMFAAWPPPVCTTHF
jgi:NAD(P)-dependent dehydrogenase (short-subunit alcohol dehydrogenase family)